MKKLVNVTQNDFEIAEVVEARNFLQRGIGLMFQKPWPANRTLWIHRCNSIHTCFMNFPLDVVFVDKKLVVKKVFASVPAWRLLLPVWSAHSVFEFTAGNNVLKHINVGDQLNVGH